MKYLSIIKCLPFFPVIFIKGIQGKKKSIEQNYEIVHNYAQKILKKMGYSLTIHGIENIKNTKGIYFVSNHQGTLDPVVICAACDSPLSFVSKQENESIPLLGRWAKNIGTIHFNRETREGNVHMLRESLRFLKKNHNILIFPEGTRSKGNQMNEFKDKAFQPAIMAKASIIPVTLNHAYCLDVKEKIKDLSIIFDSPISFEFYKNMTREELSNYVQTIIKSHLKDN
ncbi:lysophospholipid acyltransferase family protein [Floccifex sp.]|uniref:lysophospholipid acyltransferase family protein n=1 Tax=Floccifex sp. TaxID=2815810 RepID=UPI003F00408A